MDHRLSLVLAIAGTSGATLLTGCGGDAVPSPRSARPDHPAAREAWVPLPPLPVGSGIDLDGAQMTTAAGRLLVAVVARRPGSRPSEVLVAARRGRGWRPLRRGGEPLLVDRDQRMELIGGAEGCVAGAYRGRVRVRCLRNGRWRALPPAFATDERSSFGGALRDRHGVVLLRVRRVPTALAPGSRLRTTAYRLRAGRWMADPPGEIAPTVAGGAQRPFGFAVRGRACVAFDALPADRTRSPSVAVSCFVRGRWRRTGPVLDPTGGARVPGIAFGVDGAAAVGDEIHVGVDRFAGRAGDWRVHALREQDWRPTSVAGEDPEWNEQGSLFALGDELWAIRFDQRPSEDSLATRVVVLRRDPRTGRTVQVGRPLRQTARFSVPLYYGLARLGRQTYAMATVPNPRTRRDEVRVFVLRPISDDARASGG